MPWTPDQSKAYHPGCQRFFGRELSRTLAMDLFAEMDRQGCAYDQYVPSSYANPLDRDERLRSDLLECFSFVLERLYAQMRVNA
jgi:hypothetical protein